MTAGWIVYQSDNWAAGYHLPPFLMKKQSAALDDFAAQAACVCRDIGALRRV